MGIRDRYDHGVFSWVDLATTDPAAAKQFYSTLFGWTFQDMPVEGGPPYSMAFKGDRRVAALFQQSDAMQASRYPSYWQSYINVSNLEDTVQRWQEQGGTIIEASFEVMDAGSMAVVKDPTGAVLNLWQAKDHIGAEVVNEVNTFSWTELQTRGADQAAAFYQAVLGWEIEAEETPPNYITGKVNGRYTCGILDMDKASIPADIPPNWMVYFNVEDLDAALATVKAMGGQVPMEPMTIEVGRFTTILDPQGAALTLIELKDPDD